MLKHRHTRKTLTHVGVALGLLLRLLSSRSSLLGAESLVHLFHLGFTLGISNFLIDFIESRRRLARTALFLGVADVAGLGIGIARARALKHTLNLALASPATISLADLAARLAIHARRASQNRPSTRSRLASTLGHVGQTPCGVTLIRILPPAKHCPLGRSHVLKSAATLLLGIATATQLQFRMLAAMLRRLMLPHSLLHQSLVLRGVISLAALLQASSAHRRQSATLHTGEAKHRRRNASPLRGVSHHAIGPSHRTAIVLLGATTTLERIVLIGVAAGNARSALLTIIQNSRSIIYLIKILPFRLGAVAAHGASSLSSVLDDVTKLCITLGMIRMILDRHSAASIRRTAALHPANMLDTLTLLVGILHVAIDLRIRVSSRLSLAARLASLAIRAHGTAGAVHLAAALVGSTRDRTQPRLHIGIEHLRGLEGRGINLLERTIRSKALGLALHGFASLLGSLVHLVFSLRASPLNQVLGHGQGTIWMRLVFRHQTKGLVND